MSAPPSTADDFGSSELPVLIRETVTPELFQRLPFRVLSVPVKVTPREIDREMQRREMMAEFGGGAGVKGGLLELSPPPDAAALRDARQRLLDPPRRLIDEFFWFWPISAGEDAAEDAGLQAVTRGDVQGANDAWKAAAPGPDASIAKHNLAILYTLLGLETADEGATASIASTYWDHAATNWRAIFEDDTVWRRLYARVNELDDPRATVAQVRELRFSLPCALLRLHAELAVRAAARGRAAESRAHRKRMNGYGRLETELLTALENALEPTRDQLTNLNKTLEQRAQAQKDQAIALSEQHLRDTEPLLRLVDTFLPAGNSARDHVHDEVALLVFSSSIGAYNANENWVAAAALIKRLLAISATESARTRLEKNRVQVDSNIQYDRDQEEAKRCWFCRERNGEEVSQRKLQVHGNVQVQSTGSGTRTTWQYRTLNFPRCRPCRARHRWSHFFAIPLTLVLMALSGLAIYVLVYTGVYLFNGPRDTAGVAAMFTFLGLLLTLVFVFRGVRALNRLARRMLAPLLMGGAKHDLDLQAHPLFASVKAEGWKLGKSPNS